MDHLNLIPQLARARHPVSQILWGVVVSGIIIAIESVFWRWLAVSPYVPMPLGIIITSFFGGGLWAGFTATFILSFYGLIFPGSGHWFPSLIFFITGVLGTLLVDLAQNKIRELAGKEIRAEEAERLKFAAAAANIGIWEWDIPKDTLTWDDQMLTFYGLDRASFTGHVDSWRKGIHPEDSAYSNQILEEALYGKTKFELEFRVLNPSGQIKVLKANGYVMRDEKGSPIKMFGLNRDITGEKENLKKMEELKAYFEAALVQSPAGVVIGDAPTGLLRFVNPAALNIAGGDEETLVKGVDINRYARWRITDMDGVPIANEDLPLAQAIRSGETSSTNLIFIRPTGEKRVAYSQTAPVRRSDGSIISGVTVFVDITEQHKLMEELSSAREVAESAMRAKATFLDIAAHELRTPVTAASLLTQLTQRQLEKGEALDKNIIQRIRVQLDRLSRLVVDLLEVSKLDRGVLELRYEPTDLRTLVSDCSSTFQIQFPDRQITLHSSNGSIELMLDPIRIYEVVSNLIDNAIKYSPEGSPIELVLETGPESVRFLVRDHGPGLTEEGQRKLFSAFERGTTHEKTSGLGLGLFICRGIIALHDGTIGVHSAPGKGSTFYFDLPKKKEFKKTGS
ncbi:MAG: PAS domain S-box protein [Proteobacteria bacterium]|nr:PAS domain S-box protein [Pseudomonadota bacterium]